MKPLDEQDHYEILEVERNARSDEIERSYRLAQATWADDSLAGYSVLEEGDVELLRERVESAYRVLSDPEARCGYDASLRAIGVTGTEAPPPEAPAGPERPRRSPVGQLDAIAEGENAGDYDGSRLRRWRMSRGVELDEISDVTKVNTTYLGYIEDERFADLPAAVYVRGFVSAYATYLGLDPGHVATSYMRRYEEGRPQQRRGRFR